MLVLGRSLAEFMRSLGVYIGTFIYSRVSASGQATSCHDQTWQHRKYYEEHDEEGEQLRSRGRTGYGSCPAPGRPYVTWQFRFRLLQRRHGVELPDGWKLEVARRIVVAWSTTEPKDMPEEILDRAEALFRELTSRFEDLKP